MEIDSAGELIFYTYYMIDWKGVDQKPSDSKCMTCGGPMQSLQVRDKKGLEYTGNVCHGCKAVVWIRNS